MRARDISLWARTCSHSLMTSTPGRGEREGFSFRVVRGVLSLRDLGRCFFNSLWGAARKSRALVPSLGVTCFDAVGQELDCMDRISVDAVDMVSSHPCGPYAAKDSWAEELRLVGVSDDE